MTIVPHTPLPDASVITVTISRVQDLASNKVAAQSTQFTTGTGPDVVAPRIVSTNPFNGATNVPLNTVAGFAAHEQGRLQNRGKGEAENKRGLAIRSINSSVRVLRRVLKLAVEWGLIESTPKLELLSGERHRERVVTAEEENGTSPLPHPCWLVLRRSWLIEGCDQMSATGRWEEITWTNGRNGSLLVAHGKTAAARRVLPMTPRVRATLERRWEGSERPHEGWVWPAPTRNGHVDHSSLKKQHARAFRTSNAEGKKNDVVQMTPFVLYSLRHTFLTRLGQSGCDAWTLARIAGHSSIAISSRYVHPRKTWS